MEIGEEHLAVAQQPPFLAAAAPSPSRSCRPWRRPPPQFRAMLRAGGAHRHCRRSRCPPRRSVSTSTCGRDGPARARCAGTRPTRYSWFLISLGTPISMDLPPLQCATNPPPASNGGPDSVRSPLSAGKASRRLASAPRRWLPKICVDLALLHDQRRRQRDDVAGRADQDALLVAAQEGLEGAPGRLARPRLQLDAGDAGRDCADR